MFKLNLRSGIPIFWVVLAAFALIVFAQHSLYGVSIYKSAWKQYRAQIDEKHLLIARRLSANISDYLEKHIAATSHIASVLDIYRANDLTQTHKLFNSVLVNYPNIHSMNLYDVDEHGKVSVVASLNRDNSSSVSIDPSLDLDSYFTSPSRFLSGVVDSPFSHTPRILVRQFCNEIDHRRRYIIAELDPAPIERLRSKIQFGAGGHAAIIDHSGRLASHPNKQWTQEMRDVSAWPIVDTALQGKEGVMEFISPHTQENMISAFATVPEYGWVVLIPQPKSEIDNQIRSLVQKQISWIVISFLFIAFVAWRVALWISKPLRQLARHAGDLEDEQYACRTQIANAKGAPQEINRLSYALNALLTSLQKSVLRQDRFRKQILYIVEHSPLLFCVSDFNGKISYAAGRLLNEYGLTPASAVGMDIQVLFGPDVFSDDLLHQLKDGGEHVHTIDSSGKDAEEGKGKVIELWCSSLKDEDGTPNNVMVVGTDVSDTKLAHTHAVLLDENRKLNAALIQAEETERRRIAGELHDLFGQDLTAIRTYLRLINGVLSDIPSNAPEDIKSCAGHVKDYADTATQTTSSLQAVIRSMLARLWPEALDNIGFAGAIKDLTANFRKQYPHINLKTNITQKPLELTDQQAIYLYRAISECLTNIGRHAEAEHVELSLQLQDGQLVVVIADDGIGFDTEEISRNRYGITGIKERIRALRGTSFFHSQPGKGTKVQISIPLPQKAKAS
ncbi:MAG: hypothetical protein AMJ53_10275 [Gammaproteobacteria bacterium SG8_11]|nr:MAG: hypothetical protein AMJ53_10275 [Gammaproteobacteria bacterium SG8_11]